MQYETDATTRKEKTNFKTKRAALSFSTTNTFCIKIHFLENSSNDLFLGKPGSEGNKYK